jgi:crossover junction endodeoxyribonuclease RuvC
LGEAARWGPRLVELERDAGELLDRIAPAVVAVEAVFAHREHPRAAVAMAHARGVLLLAAARRGLPVIELAPASVKKSLTGLGNASKDQVAAAVGQVLSLDELPTPRDVTDAIAIAIAAAARAG